VVARRARGQLTRERLILAAEREMAQHGIDGASLKTIQDLAGQRNKSVINHYFGDRNGLVQAIGLKHRADITPLRHAALDRIERRGAPGIDALAAAMIEPAATKLRSQSGRDYLVILAEAVTRFGAADAFDALEVPELDSARRLNNMIVDVLEGPLEARRLRVGQSIVIGTVLLADIARGVDRGIVPARTVRKRVRSVVALVAAALRAPL
jgi:AcrR family transcriptional regulator